MNLSALRPAPGSHKRARRVGRGHGSGRGKTAGRGTKGQKARTGGKNEIKRAFSGGQTRLSKRLPFLRGIGNSNMPFRKDYAVVNVARLTCFEPGSRVTPEALAEKALITPAESRGLVKILGDGELDRPLTVRAHKFSESARAKIEASGGSIEVIPVKVYEKTKRRKEQSAPAQVRG
jgi:large subunit ribosomal protein L15